MSHFCEIKTKSGMYGCAIMNCEEDEEGHFWVGNGEYDSQVNYCPQCGEKAPTPAETYDE